MKHLKNIAIIPIRSGSKGIPDKNIKLLNGVPLVAYTIKAAIESKMFDTVMVSTDSEKYAEIAKQYGAEVPFLRSAETSSDTSSSWSVVREVLDNYRSLGQEYETLALLQATSPMRTGADIVGAFHEMETKDANAIVSICETRTAYDNYAMLPQDLDLKAFADDGTYRPRQSWDKYYYLNGAIWIWKVEAFYKQTTIFDEKCYGYVMGKLPSTDIDDLDDFALCEAIIKCIPGYK